MRRVLCIGTVLGFFLVAAPANAAGKPMAYAKKSFGVGPHTSKTVDLDCQTGRAPTGGGASASSSKVLLTRSSPPDPGSPADWTVAVNNPTGKRQSVTAYAACLELTASPPGFFTFTRRSALAPTGGTTSFTDTCSSGLHAMGGGFNLQTTDPAIRVQGSAPTVANDGWTVTVFNVSGVGVTIGYEAICVSGWTPAEIDASREVPVNSTKTETVKCASGQVVSGGFQMSASGFGGISASKPSGLSATPPGTGWTVRGRSGAATDTLTAYAECTTF